MSIILLIGYLSSFAIFYVTYSNRHSVLGKQSSNNNIIINDAKNWKAIHRTLDDVEGTVRNSTNKTFSEDEEDSDCDGSNMNT